MEKHDKCNSKCNSKCKCKCKALSVASYDVKLKYSPNKKTKEQTQKRKIIWFNPPYSEKVVTKVCYYFLKLLNRHSP